jgi:integrase/recombinase XerD
MTTITSSDTAVRTPFDDPEFDEGQLAAASFLARYSGRTLEAYRQDLRGFFQWAADHDVSVLVATRPHIELWRGSMEERGLAASTIDRRLSTLCGFYRFAHIDGRIGSNPAEYVRRPQVHPSDARGLDRSELGMFLAAADHYDVAHQALAVLLGLNGLRVSEACETNVEDLAVERGHRILRITGKGNKPATIPLVPRTARTIDLVVGERCEGPILRRRDGQRLDRRTAHRWWPRSASEPASATCTRTCCDQRSSWPPWTPESRFATYRPPPGTPTPGPRRSTTGAARTSTATPPTSSWPSSPEADRGSRA